ncbi:CubicO group peptidase (beta-lactamase class C family) [Sphingomonas naasensis]|uniref:Class A beta-lactamase-related serine hydrolase n=1 Tax=Sphingomonas naasensis TaxID=1344951 RepID=A0A4S1WF30_9SPHN|nr:serine hydrolase domain-containing protein [Sphingomonas naasensis]NIJ21394.1 CubicO group peptidase (beta-lactamase class C family) [Sphingomonas naasensis]TGX41644.1 class A beta-lactamase-related serine hydrolase [Sphingomonas naasensis]
MHSWRIFGSVALLALASPAWPQATVPLPSRGGPAQTASATSALAKRVVAEGKVPGIVILTGIGAAPPRVVAEGRIAVEPDAPAADADSLWRIYSMTKPITGIAAMILVEEGKLKLDQPISDFIPAFKDMKVLVDPAKDLTSRPATRPITVRNLLTHTAGLGYNIVTKGPLLDEYNRLGINPAQVNALMEPGMRAARPKTLEEFANRVATLPLIADPGAKWSYSIGLDVLGRVIEVAGGMPFDQFVNTRIFAPLKMQASFWTVPQDRARILATNYLSPGVAADAGATSVWLQPPSFPYGGAGLVMSARDYDRFLHMLLDGGALDGARILKPETVKLAMSDLLPASVDRSTLAQMTADTGAPMGFGAGGSVYLADRPGGPGKGTYGWAGAAGSVGWVDPVHKLRGTMMINSFSEQTLKRETSQAVYADLGR